MNRIPLLVMLLFVFAGVVAQLPSRKISKKDYIDLYKDIAIEEMNMYHIPASITLAQGILESAAGNSTLATKANNHFGIKCHKGWNGKTFHIDDDAKNECFRKYSNPEESFKDHSIFLSTRDRYAFLFDLDITDYKGWAKGLKKAGYATNPKYPQLLINIIEDQDLSQFDQLYQKTNYAKQNRSKLEKIKPSEPVEDFEAITIGPANRKIYENNGVKFIYARPGDSFYKIAQDFNIYTWQVYKYNDLKKKDMVSEGQMLYLERKKSKSRQTVHVVSPGETLYEISQMYGVRLKKLAKYNSLDKQATLFPDQEIKLRN